jgi:hypothetical protein
MKAKDAAKLNEEYQRLVRGLTESGVIAQPTQADAMPANPGRSPFNRNRRRKRHPEGADGGKQEWEGDTQQERPCINSPSPKKGLIVVLLSVWLS